MGLRRARIEVAIDELVLDGVKPGDPRVARAVAEAARRALDGQPAAKHADAVGRAVGCAVAEGAQR